jgi:hypothetical protein
MIFLSISFVVVRAKLAKPDSGVNPTTGNGQVHSSLFRRTA